MILKICGITNEDDAAAATAGGANAIGFNFYPPSPRYIAPEKAAEIATPNGVRRVGVFVNRAPDEIDEIARIAGLDTAQLHGDEAPAAYPASVAVWKAARVAAGFDISRFNGLPAEALLLDGPAGELYGGAGKTFDWGAVEGPPGRRMRLPHGAEASDGGLSQWRIILAGGLDSANVAQAVELLRPWGVDACSRIESSPGKKDHQKMKAYLRAAMAALQA